MIIYNNNNNNNNNNDDDDDDDDNNNNNNNNNNSELDIHNCDLYDSRVRLNAAGLKEYFEHSSYNYRACTIC